ncbi:hypothetical protein [Seinonella peptonophila]|uniref:hypothetical protein n=1 Tax=Seinonella peptonophila TaxID=112248 RepID=UPI0009330B05|nr:hypothetical protein [Seinonella peptonophila]
MDLLQIIGLLSVAYMIGGFLGCLLKVMMDYSTIRFPFIDGGIMSASMVLFAIAEINSQESPIVGGALGLVAGACITFLIEWFAD